MPSHYEGHSAGGPHVYENINPHGNLCSMILFNIWRQFASFVCDKLSGVRCANSMQSGAHCPNVWLGYIYMCYW